MNPEFEPWCRDHGLNVEQEIVNQLKVYPEDLMALVSARDARAVDILRQGLASRNPMVWILAVEGWQCCRTVHPFGRSSPRLADFPPAASDSYSGERLRSMTPSRFTWRF
jgi:hypothetical protein